MSEQGPNKEHSQSILKVAPDVLFHKLDGRPDLVLQPLGGLGDVEVGHKRVGLCALGEGIEEVERLVQPGLEVDPGKVGELLVAKLEERLDRILWVLPRLCGTELDGDL